MNNILDRIAGYKRTEIRERRALRPESKLTEAIRDRPSPRGFLHTLRAASYDGYGLIAEVKKASPSKGLIAEDFDPVRTARAYEKGGAACVSVLTDGPSFQGTLEHLGAVSAATSLPTLRKEFMLDPYQVVEARAYGADCILIIMAMVDDALANELQAASHELGMDSLIEVHDRQELDRALRLDPLLVGINNRNLKTFEVSIETTLSLMPDVPDEITVVAESGLRNRTDLDRLAEAGIRCFLIGEMLMRSADTEHTVRKLLTTEQTPS